MSFLTLPKGIPDFTKAVISFWFRVPKQSIIAAANDPTTAPPGITEEHGEHPPPDAMPNLRKVIPLITFGSEGSQKRPGGTDFPSIDPLAGHPVIWAASEVPTETPSFIGLKCDFFDEGDIEGSSFASLNINLQMPDYGEGAGDYYTPPDQVHTPPYRKDPRNDLIVRENYTETYKNGLSAGYILNREVIHIKVPSSYFDSDGALVPLSPGDILPDVWHHLLISFDLSIPLDAKHVSNDPSSAREHDTAFPMTGPKLWLAYDDMNYDREAFGDASPTYKYRGNKLPADSYDRNLVVSPNAYTVQWIWDMSTQHDYYAYGLPSGAMKYDIHYNLGDPNHPNGLWQFNPGDPDPQGGLYLDSANGQPGGWSYADGKIKTESNPIGIPASEKYVKRIHRVEMAEFQMFTEVTLDTSKEANRRAFVDFERDEDGNIILDENGRSTLKPVNPKKAEKLLGKRQDVLLHGSNNWKSGYNTGSTGVIVETDDNGNETLTKIEDGQFQPTALIKSYKPDPSLKQTG